ncbi:hypothetical protein R0131_12825 [Clostridium sp. AL.422]|uniref:hypothetical protein n=1 Tax=Clostridium TaxID=1485 RepID=UPI00293DC0AC|nr:MULTISPECIES: hypothetical protein [unclassified Clostridium]MDV4151705.1 hypothetical protein [Clostridium sp. AL.422]
MNNFNEEFIKIESERNTLKKLNSKLLAIEHEINKTEKTFEELKIKLSKEKKDVDKLESFSLSSIYYKMKGTIDEKISKEKFEFLEAQAKYIECDDYLKRLLSNKKSILNEISQLGDLDLKYNNLLNKSADYILSLNNDKSKKVSEILERIKFISIEKKEIQEALLEGDNLIPYIDNAISSLNSAKNWGIYDMMGGDLIATMAKRSKMNDASTALNSIKVMLIKYNAELDDLSENITISLSLDGISGFMDYFFDNIFTDYFIQGKINSALDSSISLKNKVVSIQNKLTNKFNVYEKDLINLKIKLEEEIKK